MDENRRSEIMTLERGLASELLPTEHAYRQAVLAAEDLRNDPTSYDADTLRRIERLLEFAKRAATSLSDLQYVAVLEVKALLSLRNTAPIPNDQILKLTWDAFELNRNTPQPVYAAFLGFAFGYVAFDLIGIEEETFPVRRAKEALLIAYEFYSRAGNAQGAPAAYLLAQIELSLLRTGKYARVEAVEKHAAARKLIGEAMVAGQSLTAFEWARRYEISASILMANPEGASAEILTEAIELLNNAQQHYRDAGDCDATSRSVFAINELMQKLGPSTTVPSAMQFEQALCSLDWVYLGTLAGEIRLPPGLESAAQAWLLAAGNATGRERAHAYWKAAQLARRLTTADDIRDDDLRARAWFLLGNALGADLLTKAEFVSSDKSATDAEKYALEEAIIALERSRDLFDFAGAGIMSVRSRMQLGKAISAQVFGYGQDDQIEACKFAWLEAVAFASDDDLVRSRLNLASALLGSARTGNPTALQMAGRILKALDLETNAQSKYRVAIVQRQTLLRTIQMQWSLTVPANGYSHAVELATNVEGRRRYLSQAALRLPKRSASEEAIRTNFLGVIRELSGMRAAGIPQTNIAHWREALACVVRDRAITEELAERAQRDHSSSAGKALLMAHLDTGAPFILLLRSFQLETLEVPGPVEPGSYAEESYYGLIGGGHSGWKVISTSLHRLGEALSSICATLLITNREDPIPSAAVAKLFEPPYEWRNLVFSLIAEASAIVVGVPTDLDKITGGLSDELRAIGELNAIGRSVLILQPRPRSQILEVIGDVQSSSIQDCLKGNGFPFVFVENEAELDIAAISAAVKSILSKKSSVGSKGAEAPADI